jgi:hypothetical protein
MGARARRGQPRQYSHRSGAGAAANGGQAAPRGADAYTMRALLEYLGIVEPPRGRREPVALPAWSRALVPILAPASAFLSRVARALSGR